MTASKTPGQLAYEADVKHRPTYHDGGIRKTWEQLPEIIRNTWERAHHERREKAP